MKARRTVSNHRLSAGPWPKLRDATQRLDPRDEISVSTPWNHTLGGVIMPVIAYQDFLRVDIRVGTVVAAEAFPEAKKPAFKLTIDFGPDIGLKRSSAQVTRHYTPENLVGRQVAAVVNFPPRQIGPFMSQVLTLGFPDGDGEVVLMSPTLGVPDGGRMF